MDKALVQQYRSFLKDTIRKRIDFSKTDQSRGIAPPPIEKPAPAGGVRIDLAAVGGWKGIADIGLTAAIGNRRSHRTFRKGALSLDELSFLLWATQGVREARTSADGVRAFRTVPSAGCRHAFETYLVVSRVAGLRPGLYRYQPLEHHLCLLKEDADLPARTAQACRAQRFVADAAVTFVWTAIPYRMEWRYTVVSHKVIALDAGHVCQNLYLACEAIGAGTCAIAAYTQGEMDEVVGVDGVDEFTLYVAPVGKVAGTMSDER